MKHCSKSIDYILPPVCNKDLLYLEEDNTFWLDAVQDCLALLLE